MAAKKKRVAILFGGKSGEHEVSITSAVSVFNALDKSKYEVQMIGIDKGGRWLLPSETKVLAHGGNPRLFKLNKEKETVSLVPFESDKQLVKVEGSEAGSGFGGGKFDVIIPILHGPFGEDGTVQGLLEMANIPYVGSGVLGSAVGMDKDVSRRLLAAAGIPCVPTLVYKRANYERDKKKAISESIAKFGLPLFVKPANMGSSVGVSKVKTEAEAQEKFDLAFAYDNKILVEKAVAARELECSVLGNHDPKASIVGEIVPQHEFYSYEAKYMDENGALLEIPAKGVTPEQVSEIQRLSVHAFQVLECAGLARVDFFMDKASGALYLNEINTIPGFTKISMYPKLWEASGLPYAKLLDELIRLAIERHSEKNALKTSYEPEEE